MPKKVLSAASALALLLLTGTAVRADTTPFNLTGGNFFQDWSNLSLITTDNDWSGVPSITGYLGEYTAANPEGVDPRTLTGTLTNLSLATVSVIANQTSPNTLTAGGVAEFHSLDAGSAASANPTIGLQGGPDADAPFLVVFLNTTGRQNITGSLNLRDLDGSSDDVTSQFVVQYRVGDSGDFVNLVSTFIGDMTLGPNETIAGTGPVPFLLPADANNQPLVQVRFITTNSAPETSNMTGNTNDEWIGLDDIRINSQTITAPEPEALALLLPVVTGGLLITRRRYSDRYR
jgi:uncharacterized protein